MSVSTNKVFIKQISKGVFEIYGLVNGMFVKRQYVGYTKKQAIEKFRNSVKRGEI